MNEKHPERAGFFIGCSFFLPRATRTRIFFQPETKYCLLPRAIKMIAEV